jgi:hypothetical protein
MAKKIKHPLPVEAATVEAEGSVVVAVEGGEYTQAEAESAHVAGVETVEVFDPSTGKVETVVATPEITPKSNAPADYVETDPSILAGANSQNGLVRDRAKLLTDVGRLGKADGSGKASKVALAERVVEASENGIIGTDDAERIYEKFRTASAAAAGKLAADEQSKDSRDVQVSKLRRFIEVGKAFDNSWNIFETAVDMHVQALGGDDKKLLRVHSCYESLVAVARAQLRDRWGIKLSEDDIRKVLFKEYEEPKETTGLDLVKHALKNMEQAMSGRKAGTDRPAREPLRHDNILEAVGHIRFVISELDPEFFAKEEAERAAAEKKELAAIQKAEKKAAGKAATVAA